MGLGLGEEGVIPQIRAGVLDSTVYRQRGLDLPLCPRRALRTWQLVLVATQVRPAWRDPVAGADGRSGPGAPGGELGPGVDPGRLPPTPGSETAGTNPGVRDCW